MSSQLSLLGSHQPWALTVPWKVLSTDEMIAYLVRTTDANRAMKLLRAIDAEAASAHERWPFLPPGGK